MADKDIQLTVSFPKSIYEEIGKLADEETRSMRGQVLQLVKEALLMRRAAKQQEEETDIQMPGLVAA